MTHVNPNLDQDSFRGRNDDGSESAATWKATTNTNWTQAVDTNFRVRFLVQEDAGGTENNVNLQFQYNLNGAGWNSVNGTSSVVQSSLSGNFAEDDNTTQQIGAGTFITPNSGMDEDEGLAGELNDIDFAGNDEVEVEYCCQILSGDVADSDTIQLRVVRGDLTVLETYTNTPTVTVSESADTNVAANTHSMTLTEQVASIALDVTVAATVAALTLSTFSASVNAETNVQASTASLTVTEQSATINAATNIQASTDALTLTEQTATVEVGGDTNVSAKTDALTLTEQSATVNAETNVNAGVTSLTLTEQTAEVNAETNVQASTGALTLSGFSATVNAETNVSAGVSALTLTEFKASLGSDTNISAEVDVLTLTEFGASISAASGKTPSSIGTVRMNMGMGIGMS